MKINNEKPVAGVDRGTTPAAEGSGAPARTDRVTLEESQQAAQAVEVARHSATGSRAMRLRQLEDAPF